MKGMEGIPALNFKQTNKPNTELKQWNVTQRIYTPVLSFRIHFPFRPLYCFVIVIRRVVAAVITGRKYNIIVNGKKSFRWIDLALCSNGQHRQSATRPKAQNRKENVRERGDCIRRGKIALSASQHVVLTHWSVQPNYARIRFIPNTKWKI